MSDFANVVPPGSAARSGGIRLTARTAEEAATAQQAFWSRLRALELEAYVTTSDDGDAVSPAVGFRLSEDHAAALAPAADTTRLCEKLHLDTQANPRDLEKEILLALLLAPIPYEFPSYDELESAVRIRMQIVAAARKTGLTFGTGQALRPTEYWRYDEDHGFLLVPGQSLVTALRVATQPGGSQTMYTFSCRRAAEFVVLLGLAQELQTCNPDLYQRLTRQFETRAIKGGEFETVFLRPIGSPSHPLPLWFFVPGDWVWFKNPDPASAEIAGFEGSHTIYLGGGMVADFWTEGESSHLTLKYIRIFHWQYGVIQNAQGELDLDDVKTEALSQAVLERPAEVQRILQEMVQLQSPRGDSGGGCIEPTRDCLCRIRPGTATLVLPDVA